MKNKKKKYIKKLKNDPLIFNSNIDIENTTDLFPYVKVLTEICYEIKKSDEKLSDLNENEAKNNLFSQNVPIDSNSYPYASILKEFVQDTKSNTACNKVNIFDIISINAPQESCDTTYMDKLKNIASDVQVENDNTNLLSEKDKFFELRDILNGVFSTVKIENFDELPYTNKLINVCDIIKDVNEKKDYNTFSSSSNTELVNLNRQNSYYKSEQKEETSPIFEALIRNVKEITENNIKNESVFDNPNIQVKVESVDETNEYPELNFDIIQRRIMHHLQQLNKT